MILYFSGTGNSRYAAKYIANITKQEIVDMGELIKHAKPMPKNPSGIYVFVAPMYCWKLPRIVESLIFRAEFEKGSKAYFILTAGEANGNANNSITTLCKEKGLDYMGGGCITMPENYIAIYSTPEPEELKRIIDEAQKPLKTMAEAIAKGETLEDTPATALGFLLSGIVNDVFYSLIVKDSKFAANEKCNSCGLCEKVCVLNNVKLVEGKPKWLGKCTHCMACICRCPMEAINYGRGTEKKKRYYLN